ncbi:MAG: TRAP transporter large permease subunit [Calditrichaeota bacterium]|nr:TRAP transporter large permease subunit [Calditrichota bacterium]
MIALVFILLAFSGLPLFLAISGLALAGFAKESLQLSLYFAEVMRLANNPTLMAIPLFTLGGYLLAESNASRRLVNLVQVLIGWLPGGIAIVTLLVMALLTAFTGASGITIIALGGLMLPTLLKSGFSERFSLGLLTSSGSIGLLFPPSLPLILYGVVSSVPIDKLFIAGIVPGLLFVICISLFSYLKGRRNALFRPSEPAKLWPALKGSLGEIILPVIIIGGIYSGKFTVSEAAVLTVVYLLIVEVVLYRDIKLVDLPRIFIQSSVLVGGILVILAAALALTNYIIFTDIPSHILNLIKNFLPNRWAFLIALNIFLLIVGCLMDIFSALVVIVPLILPLAQAYGVDFLHLGIIFLANLEIGYSTPPVGLNLFIASFRFQKPIVQLYRAALPFLLIQLLALLAITYIPALSLASVALFSSK